MAMPAEAPAPCSAKLAPSQGVSNACSASRSGLPTCASLFAFAELVADQRDQRAQRRIGILADGVDLDAAALSGGQHHYSHDALGVDAPAVARQPDVRLESAGGLGQFGRGARVQAQLVDD